MDIIVQLWWLWLAVWVVGLGAATYFQLSNMKKIQSMDLEGVNQVAPVVAMLASGVGFLFFLISVAYWLLVTFAR